MKFVKLIILLLSIQFSNTAYSQFAIGVRGGVQQSKVLFDQIITQKFLNGNTFGVDLKYINESFAGIILECNLTQKGWHEYNESNAAIYYKKQITYLQVPLLSHFYYDIRKTRIFLNAGPYLAYQLSKKEEFYIREHPDYKDKLYDFGVTAGIGVEQLTPIGGFAIEFRGEYGFMDVISKDNGRATDYAQNLSFSLNLIYYLEFSKK